VEHTYEYFGTYDAKLEVTDEKGAIDRATVTIEVNSPPVAHLAVDLSEGNAPLLVAFDASHSVDFDGSIVKYEWDWETDGIWDFGSDTEPNASYVYESIGLHRASVRVTDDDGGTGCSSVSIRVNHPPVAMLTADIVHGAGPLCVNFDASGSRDPDGTVEGYEWDWESDGTFDYDSDANPAAQHTYDSSGTYSATVRVTDDDADWGTDSIIITVGEHEEQWVHTWGGGDDECAWDLALASSGSVYVTGFSKSFGAGDYDVLLLKYDSSGNLRWQKTWGGSEDDWGYGVGVDEYENVYVSGVASISEGAFLLKYDFNGNLLWQKTWEGNCAAVNRALAIDVSGNVYVTGTLYDGDLFLLKYNPDGSILWQRTLDCDRFDTGYSIATDGSGYVYVAGYTLRGVASTYDTILLKYDSYGNLLWQKTWPNFGLNDELGYSVAVDEGGNVYITGEKGPRGDYYNEDTILLKLDSMGNLLWQKTWDNCEKDNGLGIAVGDIGDVYITGYSWDRSINDNGLVLMKYDRNGSLLWQRVWSDAKPSCVAWGTSVIADQNGKLFLAGFASNAHGSWLSVNGEVSTPEGTTGALNGAASTPTGTETIPEGIETSPEGVIDEGGGGDDVLIMKLDPSQL